MGLLATLDLQKQITSGAAPGVYPELEYKLVSWDEIYPLAMFGQRKFGNTDQILMQPIIGNQSYDAVVTDLTSKPASRSYIEITQSHEGESEYLRRCVLEQRGIVTMHGPVIKTGTKKTGRQVNIPRRAVNADEIATKELKKIADAAKRKAGKDYPVNTSLIIVFEDDWFFRQAVDDSRLDTFVKENILKLDLRFSTLYLIGWHSVFREFSLAKRT
ncbi:MAG: hypothetical protein WBH01_04935 [Dehalococcoidia bacterium]